MLATCLKTSKQFVKKNASSVC